MIAEAGRQATSSMDSREPLFEFVKEASLKRKEQGIKELVWRSFRKHQENKRLKNFRRNVGKEQTPMPLLSLS